MRRNSTSYYLLTAALLLGGFFAITACENDPKEVDALFKQKLNAEEGKMIESYLSQSGTVKAKLTAPFMLRYQRPDSAFMEFPRTLHVDFYDTTTAVESTLDARYAKYIEFQHKVLLRDSVVVLNLKYGDTLLTEELWWDQDKQEFYTSKPANVWQKNKRTFARDGLKAKQDLSAYTFYGSSGTIKTKEGDGIPL